MVLANSGNTKDLRLRIIGDSQVSAGVNAAIGDLKRLDSEAKKIGGTGGLLKKAIGGVGMAGGIVGELIGGRTGSILGSVSAIAAGGAAGSLLGPWGAAVGASIAALREIKSYFDDVRRESEGVKKSAEQLLEFYRGRTAKIVGPAGAAAAGAHRLAFGDEKPFSFGGMVTGALFGQRQGSLVAGLEGLNPHIAELRRQRSMGALETVWQSVYERAKARGRSDSEARADADQAAMTHDNDITRQLIPIMRIRSELSNQLAGSQFFSGLGARGQGVLGSLGAFGSRLAGAFPRLGFGIPEMAEGQQGVPGLAATESRFLTRGADSNTTLREIKENTKAAATTLKIMGTTIETLLKNAALLRLGRAP